MCIFSGYNERQIKKLRKIVNKINALEPFYEQKTDAELQAMTPEFKRRLAEGATLDELLPEAYALVREASKRRLGMRHFDVQLMGGIALHQGRIAEMATGEGKTLVSTLPAYLNALTGKGVHIVTVNDYLAKRDAEWMGKVFLFLGLSVGVAVERMSLFEKQLAYRCDVLYATNHALGFDYLRDNMMTNKRTLVQRDLNFAIIDEVDSILIDEARSPLIISGQPAEREELYLAAQRFVRELVPDDYKIDEEKNTIALTESGTAKAEARFKKKTTEKKEASAEGESVDPDELGESEELSQSISADALHAINNALRANYMLRINKDYAVDTEKKEVVLIDEATGRLMVGRRLSNGLHQAVEAKEKLPIRNETATLASISLQNFFRLYKKISGMTGTAKEEETEFKKTYSLDIVSIPTNKPSQRLDQEDVVFTDSAAKIDAIVEDIKISHEKGQPVLVGTTSVEKSMALSARLKAEKIEHEVLNAIDNKREAEIVAQAGRSGQVTIATNMAGRGTDIILGGNPDFEARLAVEKEFAKMAALPFSRNETPLLVQLRAFKEDVEKRFRSMSPDERKEISRTYVAQGFNKERALDLGKASMLADVIHVFVEKAVNPFRAADPLLDEVTEKYKTLLEQYKKDAEEDRPKVLAAGGLRVIGTERHDSRRIDNQLRGRSGRQGDVGSSIFYISLEDDLLRIFGKDNSLLGMVRSTMARAEGQMTGKMVTSMIKRAQSKVENYHYTLRKSVLAYDDVMNRQREIIYAERKKVLQSDDLHEEIVKMVPDIAAELVANVIDYSVDYVTWDYDKINYELERHILPWKSNVVDKDLAAHLSFQRIVDAVTEAALDFYEKRKQEAEKSILLQRKGPVKIKYENGEEFWIRHDVLAMFDKEAVKEEVAGRSVTLPWIEKSIMLQAVDRNWKEQMLAMEELRNGIQFRALGNKDPVMCYASEGFELFDQMSENIRRETVLNVFNNLKRIYPAGEIMAASLTDREAVEEKTKKVGRNDPCPCGSGKKYKNCCGKNV